jgi:hypothetical protein
MFQNFLIRNIATARRPAPAAAAMRHKYLEESIRRKLVKKKFQFRITFSFTLAFQKKLVKSLCVCPFHLAS